MIEKRLEFNGSKITLNGINYLARRVKNLSEQSEKLVITYSDGLEKKDYVLTTQLDSLNKDIFYEDPRWFINPEDELYCSVIVVHFIKERGHNTAVGYFKFIKEQSIQKLIIPDFKQNVFPFKIEYLNSTTLFPLEKNWQFFFSGNNLYCYYSLYPESILLKIKCETGEILRKKRCVYPRNLNYGFISGGANPVLKDDFLYSFFHTFTEIKALKGEKKRNYHIGVALIDKNYPFLIRKISEYPIYSSTASNPSNLGDYIIFPGSVSYENDTWQIFCGKNDEELVTIEMETSELARNLILITTASLFHKIKIDLIHLYFQIRRKGLSFYIRIVKRG